MKRRIFLDDTLNEHFSTEGYVTIPLLSRMEAESFRAEVLSWDAGVNAPFYASLWSRNRSYRETVDRRVKELLAGRVAPFLDRYQPFFSDLLVKNPSLNHVFMAHQDWTFVDEDVYTSAYVWCPLQNVHFFNGSLRILPRSHRVLSKIRGANIDSGVQRIAGRIYRKLGRTLRLKAGEAVIFNQALLHGSSPNRTLRKRIAAGLLFLPEEAPVLHYFRSPQTGETFRIQADYNFFMRYSMEQDFTGNLKKSTICLPEGMVTEPVQHEDVQWTYKSFRRAYQAEFTNIH